MAKKMMARTRIERAMVKECFLCNLSSVIRDEVEARLEKTKELFPEKETRDRWSMVDQIDGVPGYNLYTYRPEKENDYGYRVNNGLYLISETQLCADCAAVILKGMQNIGEAEEISYSRKESCKEVVYPEPGSEEYLVTEEM